jgi:type I restriction enzyme S subunit
LTGEWKEEIAKATAYLGKSPIAVGGDLAKISSHAFNPVLLVYFFFAPFMIHQKAAKANGTMIVHIGKEAVCNLLIPLPPLAEQKRIVAKIEELLPLIDRYEKAWSKLEDFNKRFPVDMQKSLLQMAIQGKLVDQRPEEGTGEELYRQIQAEKQRLVKSGKIKKEKPLPEITEGEKNFDIPECWTWVRVGDVCTNIQYGSSKKSAPTGTVPVLRMGNIQNGRIDYNKLVFTSDEEEIQKYSLEVDDLLFNRTNSKELVGKVAIYKGEQPAIYAGYLVRLTPVNVFADYLNYVMQSQYYWGYCQSVRSDAIGQSNINAEKLKRFVVPLPPLAEQKRIVAKLEEILPLCERLK